MKRITSLFLAFVLVAGLLAIPVHAATPLSDISGHWAEDAIRQAVDEGWVNGYPDGTFRPDQTISRAEMTKMLLAAIRVTSDSEIGTWYRTNARFLKEPEGINGWTNTPEVSFSDMNRHWLTAQGWTETAIQFGLLIPLDYYGRRFDPGQAITRGEIAVLTVRALGLVYPAQQPSEEEIPFTDLASFEEFRTGYIREAAKSEVIAGYPDGSFGPERTATRAEAVTMVARVVAEMERGTRQDITLIVRDRDPDGGKEHIRQGCPALWLEDTLYIPARKLMPDWYSICTYQKWEDWMEETASVWLPTRQIFFSSWSLCTRFRAGSTAFTHDALPDTSDIFEKYATDNLVAPARLVYGELMIPIYNKDATQIPWITFCWSEGWDGESSTLTLDIWQPWKMFVS